MKTTEMTGLQTRIIGALSPCRFPCASYSKRFVRDMQWYVQENKSLSEKQIDYLVSLFHSYRKQIPEYEAICLELNPDAFTLEFGSSGNAEIKPIAKKGGKILAQL